MRSGEQFNIPARNERRMKHTEAREDSRSPAELQCSVITVAGLGMDRRLQRDQAPWLCGDKLYSQMGRLRPRHPAGCPHPCCFWQSLSRACSGGRALLSSTSPWPQVRSPVYGAPGVHSSGGSQHRSGCGWRGRAVPAHGGTVGGRRA